MVEFVVGATWVWLKITQGGKPQVVHVSTSQGCSTGLSSHSHILGVVFSGSRRKHIFLFVCLGAGSTYF